MVNKMPFIFLFWWFCFISEPSSSFIFKNKTSCMVGLCVLVQGTRLKCYYSSSLPVHELVRSISPLLHIALTSRNHQSDCFDMLYLLLTKAKVAQNDQFHWFAWEHFARRRDRQPIRALEPNRSVTTHTLHSRFHSALFSKSEWNRERCVNFWPGHGGKKEVSIDRKRKRQFGGNQYTYNSHTDLSDGDEDREQHELAAACALDSDSKDGNDDGKKPLSPIGSRTASTSELAGVNLKPG